MSDLLRDVEVLERLRAIDIRVIAQLKAGKITEAEALSRLRVATITAMFLLEEL